MILRFNKRILTAAVVFSIFVFLGLNSLVYHAASSDSLYKYLRSADKNSYAAGLSDYVIGFSGGKLAGGGEDDENDWCSKVSGKRYLEDLASTWTESCSSSGDGVGGIHKGSIVCFQAQVEETPDNFCVARNAVYRPYAPLSISIPSKTAVAGVAQETKASDAGVGYTGEDEEAAGISPSRPRKRYQDSRYASEIHSTVLPWSLSCSRKTEWSYGVQNIDKFRTYFSDTGAGRQLAQFNLNSGLPPPNEVGCKDSIMLVKLEGGGNIWHTLMEVWSAVLTLDTLGRASEAREKLGFVGEDEGIWDESNVKVYIQENMDSEMKASPIFDLWRVVTGTAPLNGTELRTGCYKSVILPLAGGANPFWKDHWKERRCETSSLVDGFVDKVFSFYNVDLDKIQEVNTASKDKTRVRIIARKHNRKILKLYDYVRNLQAKHLDCMIEILTLEHMSIKEQLELIQETDVLIGVTGAGLTHTMFLRQGAAIVELMQPEPFVYYGFGNIARMRGLNYFSVHGEDRGPGKNGDWQQDNVLIDEATFMKTVGEAIESQKNLEK